MSALTQNPPDLLPKYIPLLYSPTLLTFPPFGRFGIRCEFDIDAVEHDLPAGWGSSTHESPLLFVQFVNEHVQQHFLNRGFVQHSPTDFQHPSTKPFYAYLTMASLTHALPVPSMLATTVKNVEMYAIQEVSLSTSLDLFGLSTVMDRSMTVDNEAKIESLLRKLRDLPALQVGESSLGSMAQVGVGVEESVAAAISESDVELEKDVVVSASNEA
ncbi:hypothetical protein BKA70DRAFT_1572057 [Coprinopsis sp. MPI-PUGE-AT-0042]|nr:hypothetical protein BKA70DRAFT_1572057 [Coprinopsis sp. MPI-PUGE-AT-0042]